VDRLIGLDGVLSDIAMMRAPDGHGRVELTKFRRPSRSIVSSSSWSQAVLRGKIGRERQSARC